MWSLRTIAFTLLFAGGCLSSLVNPLMGAITYMMVYQVHPNDTWWGKPLADEGVRFSMLAALFTILGVAMATKRVPKNKPWISSWEWGLIGLLVIGTVNTHITGIGATSVSHLLLDKFWKMVLFVLVLNRLASTRENIRIVFWTVVAGTLYLGYDAYTAPSDAYFRGRLNFVGGPDFATTSGLAAHLGAMLPLVGCMFLVSRTWRGRAAAAISCAFGVNAIILCRTRSAFVGLMFGGIVAMLMAPKKRRFRINVMLIAGAIAAFSLTDTFFWHRMATMQSQETLQADDAAMTRFKLWAAAGEIIVDYPQGVGMGNFTRIIGTYNHELRHRACHNTVLLATAELGVHGGLLLMVMAVGNLITLRKCTKLAKFTRNPLETQVMAYAALVSFVTYFTTGLGTERLYCESFWWVFAIPQWLNRMVLQEIQDPVADWKQEPALLYRSEFQDLGGYGSDPYRPSPTFS